MEAKSINYSQGQLWSLVLLRWFIGWHFLYEGIVKLWNPGWSARGFLLDSKGWFAELFYSMAGSDGIMKAVDFLNVWGLTLIGLALILGLFTRWAAILGGVLLLFYFLSHPPLIGVEYALPSEGSYLFVNKNLIEAFALFVIAAFPTSKIIGLDRLVAWQRKERLPDEPAGLSASRKEKEVAV